MKIKKKSNAVRVPPVPKAIKVKRNTTGAVEETTVQKALQDVKKVLEKKNSKLKKDTPTNAGRKKIAKQHRLKRPRQFSSTRGLVYIGHIPHGFYEEAMEDYFNQFGKVTRVRVARSKNTGKSRGYGYVEFLYPDVAKIAAETMNNYLMCGRLLKAAYIPPEQQHRGFFAGKTTWSEQSYPKLEQRLRTIRKKNMKISDEKQEKFVQKTKQRLQTLGKKLKEKGVDLNLDSAVVSEN